MRTLTVTLVTLFFATAAHADPCTPGQVAGSWIDESGTTYVVKGKKAKLKSVVASDGEKYKPKSSTLGPAGWEFSYFVPSTDYLVSTRVPECTGSHVVTEWWNDHDASGPGYMDRQ